MSKYIEAVFKDELTLFRASSSRAQIALLNVQYHRALNAAKTHVYTNDAVATKRTSIQLTEKYEDLLNRDEFEEAYILCLNTHKTYSKPE